MNDDTITAAELTRIIKSCFIDSIDVEGNLVKVIDHETLFLVYLQMINSLADRIQVLEEKDAIEKKP